jgi:two-component system sensor histidine kinase/response regulator
MTDAVVTSGPRTPVATPVKCLLVDDREENLLGLSAVLRADGVEIHQARSGAEALSLMLDHDFALALIDVQMPEMDGFEVAELMRGSERTRHVPIIFVTAGAHHQSRIFKGYDSGAVDFLVKPIEPQILRNKAEVFFQLYRQRQQLARELVERTESLRLNEMLTAVLGHDLRNPLNVISTGAEVLERTASDPAVRRTAATMLASARRMTRLIDDLLDLARARLAGGIPLERQELDLVPVIHRVAQEHRTVYVDRPLEVTHEGHLVGHWDGDRLAQLVSNLLGNALTHGQPDTPVRLHADGTDRGVVRLTVENVGVIDEDVRPHLFTPFTGGTRRRPEGLGLGLYIVQQIVKAHDGAVEVTCADGTTRFTVSLPRAHVGVVRL